MKLRELSAKALEKIKRLQCDILLEGKHEWESWKVSLRILEPEFIEIEGYYVLLPISREHHPNITIFRFIVSEGKESLTIFLRDTTFLKDPEAEKWFGGFVAICEKVPGEEFYVATLYHEWYIPG